MNTDPRLHEYYETRAVEAQRLFRREGQLEIDRTKELLERFLPDRPARVIDIGGGTGVYASWLASLGHEVHLVDIVPVHVERASQVGTFSIAVADARSLPDADDSYDIALLLGPMYHLLDPDDRLQALREARRVVRGGGLVVAAFISRLAVALDGFVKGWIYGDRGRDAVAQVVQGGTARAAPVSDRSHTSICHLRSDQSSNPLSSTWQESSASRVPAGSPQISKIAGNGPRMER